MDDRQEGQLAQVEKPTGTEIVVPSRRPEGYIPVRIRQWEDGLKFAGALIKADVVKKRGINTPERGLFVILTGQEMGIAPTRSLRSMFVTPNGTLGMDAQLMAALFNEKGGRYKVRESTAQKCVIDFTWKGQEHTETFTLEDAKRAELLTPVIKGGGTRADGLAAKDNWRRYPQLMLRWRPLGNGIRFIAPEVFGGFITEYEVDEVEDRSRAGQTATDANVDALREKLADQAAKDEVMLEITKDGEVLTICPECGIATSEGDLADRDRGVCMWCVTGDPRPVGDSEDPTQEELPLDE